MADRGRYTAYERSKIERRKRTIRLPGDFEETNQFVRCWNCGYTVDLSTDVGSPDRTGNYETDAVIPSQNVPGSGDQLTIMSTLETFNMVGVALELGADGNPITEYYTPRVASVSRGCPLCGINNL